MEICNGGHEVSWDANKYFSKAQVYWERAAAVERGSDQFLLNVAFSCEFIIRGTITFVNPALNAASDGDSILYASGIPPQSPPRTIELKQALERFQRIIPDVTKSEVEKVGILIETRNKELHGDALEFELISSKDIMPSIYSFIVKACNKAGQDISVLLGSEEGRQAIEVSKAIARDRNSRIKDWINAHKHKFFGSSEDNQKECRERAKVSFESAVTTSGRHIKKEKCPSCANLGLLVGVPVGESSPILKGQEIIKEVRVSPISFTCKCCGLGISGLDELIAAGFSHEYYTIDDIDPVEHFDIDPMNYIDAEEIIREYGRDMYEYQDE